MTETTSQRAIGRLEGKLDALIETVKEQGERSDESRSRLYQRMEAIAKEQTRSDGELKAVTAAVARIEPIANRFASLEQRGLAIFGVVAVVWVLVGGAVTNGITSFLSWVAKAVSQS